MDVIVMDKLEDMQAAIEYNGGGISELLGKGCVKSVQYGTVSVATSPGGTTKTVDISTIDPAKAFVIINTKCDDPLRLSDGYITGKESESISFVVHHSDNQNSRNIKVSWQVIELY